MTDTLGVEVGRTGLHSLEVPESFETGDPFSVAVRNHGEATHVHLHLDDTLSSIASLAANNHYVGTEETRLVDIEIDDPETWNSDTVCGQLKVVTGHGTETRYVSVTLDRQKHTESVTVDPELSKPQTEDGDGLSLSPAALRVIPIGVLGGVAIILAVAALTAGGGLSSFFAGVAVVAAVACAVSAYYLLR